MSEQNSVPPAEPVASGRLQRRPLATLARISRMAATAGEEDVKLPSPAEIDELIAYLTLAKKVGGMTIRQVDAFWDLNRQLVAAQRHVRAFYRDRPAFGPGPYPDVPDTTPGRWFDALDEDEEAVVLKAAFAQFKGEFTPEVDREGKPIDYGVASPVP